MDFPHQLVGVEERFHGRSGNFCYNRVPTSCAVWRLVCPPRNTPKCAAEFRQLLIRDRMALLRLPLFRELDLLDELRRVVLLVDLDVEVSALPDSDVHELAGWTGRRVRAGTHHQGRPREDQRGAVEEPEMLRPSLLGDAGHCGRSGFVFLTRALWRVERSSSAALQLGAGHQALHFWSLHHGQPRHL